MSGLKVHTAWTTSAVATSDQKSFMRVDFNDDDTLIGELIKVAQNNVEEYTGRAITQQTLQLFLDRLPYYRDENLREGVYTAPDINYSADYIVLPKPPVASITHVKYYANDNTASTPWTYGDSVWNIPNSLGIDNTTIINSIKEKLNQGKYFYLKLKY